MTARMLRCAATGALAALTLLAAAAPAAAQGLVREPEAEYRSVPAMSRFRSYLPPELDLSADFPTPGAQGPQASCTGWAVGYALRSYYERRRRGWDLADRQHLFSPAFLYNQLAVGDPSCRRGSSISQALELLRRRGAVSLADFPYDPGTCRAEPGPTLLAAADQFRIAGWRRVDARALDDVKGALHGGDPVVFGMDLSPTFEGLRRGEIYDDTEAPRSFAHAMVLVGYSERRQAFKLINSWGTGWAEDGFGWISYRAFAALADRAFVVTIEDGAAPVAAKSPPALATPVPASLPATAPLKPAVAPPSEGLAGRQLDGFQCASLRIVGAAPARRVEGFVASIADLERLRREMAGAAATHEVTVRPWPQCGSPPRPMPCGPAAASSSR
jgi:Papain family cysteine protease